jgi:hypothetical protein
MTTSWVANNGSREVMGTSRGSSPLPAAMTNWIVIDEKDRVLTFRGATDKKKAIAEFNAMSITKAVDAVKVDVCQHGLFIKPKDLKGLKTKHGSTRKSFCKTCAH